MVNMTLFRGMIIVGQLGRVWARNHLARKVFQSMTAVGFYSLMSKVYSENEYEDQIFTIVKYIQRMSMKIKSSLSMAIVIK